MLLPPPVVVDADVLLRNVDYAIRKGYAGALTQNASTRYSMVTSVVLFASAEAAQEVARHLQDIAARRQVELAEVTRVWSESFAPAVRFVDVPEDIVDDPRVDGTDPKDQHTARLACLLAPAVLATDNRKHFKPFGLADTKTDAVAIDLANVGRFVTNAKGAAVLPTLAGALTVSGSKKVIARLGRSDSVLIFLVLVGALVLLSTSPSGRAARAKMGEIAEEFGPKLADVIADANASGDRVHAVAIDQVCEPGPVALLARRLATGKQVMTTAEVAEWFKQQRLTFRGGRHHQTETSAWLMRTPCFVEVSRGHWALGRHL